MIRSISAGFCTPLDPLEFRNREASLARKKAASSNISHAMRLLLWRLLALGGGIIGSASMPTRLQGVLSVVDKVQVLNEASFGVGFDLTASYGQATQPLSQKLKS